MLYYLRRELQESMESKERRETEEPTASPETVVPQDSQDPWEDQAHKGPKDRGEHL